MSASRPFWKWHHWKSIGFCPQPETCRWNLKLKFHSKVMLRKPCRLENPETKNMAARPFWIWHCRKSIGFYQHVQVLCDWSFFWVGIQRLETKKSNMTVRRSFLKWHRQKGIGFCFSLDCMCKARPLRWRHNEHDCVSNHQHHHCLLNRLFGCRSKETSKLRVTGLCVGNSPGTGEFPAQMASNAENVSFDDVIMPKLEFGNGKI